MDREPVPTCADLAKGDVVQAYTDSFLRFMGCVTEIQPEQELFWAVDGIGHRRLIDLGSYRVYRLSPPFL